MSSTFRRTVTEQIETGDSRVSTDNREIYVVAIVFSLIFIGMVIYLGWFSIKQAPLILGSTYNSRIKIMAEKSTRGEIYSADGVLLATNTTDEEGKSVRTYPQREVFSHAVGYTIYGGLGAERNDKYYLYASHSGIKAVIKNELFGTQMKGDDIHLTLDSKLQQAAYDALGDYQGAVVAVEPSTGKILAMVSKPDFDPNSLEEIWADITADGSDNTCLLNRATQGLYPPGSTFKVLTSLEYFREHPDFADEVLISCDGTLEYGDLVIRCSELTAHGETRLSNGLAFSCNGVYASIGKDLSVEGFSKLCNDLMFNQYLTTSLDTRKSSFVLNEESGEWMKMQTAIGQGETLVTPLQEAMIAATIANKGIEMKPYILDYVTGADGSVVETFEPEVLSTPMEEGETLWLTDMMKTVIEHGTGYMAASDEYQVAGKTGSAQYSNSEDTHALFIGFAPADDPQIAICVVVEKGGSGGKVAAPIAKKVFDQYLLVEN